MSVRWRTATLMLLAWSACSKRSAPWVDRVEVDAFEGGEVISLSKDELRQTLLRQLEAAHFLVLPERPPSEDAKAWRFKLAAGLTEPDIEHQSSSVALVLEVRHLGDAEPFSIDVRQHVAPPAGNDAEAMQGAIRAALQDGLARSVRESSALIAHARDADEALVDLLKDKDGAVVDAAVRLLVRHRHKAALPALLKQLDTNDVDALRRVMGQLIELRAPEAVNPLIDAAHRRGPVFQREVVFAVGAIGGDDAEAYLDMVSTGHDDALVRASATQALTELRARRSKPNSSSGTPP